MSTRITLDFNNMLSETVGEGGISGEQLNEWGEKCSSALSAINKKRAEGKLDFLDLPYNQDAVCDDIINYVNAVKNDFEAFVVLVKFNTYIAVIWLFHWKHVNRHVIQSL